ncbi:TetR/AcrR family transcriptional regulator [Paenibacillus crassostreae]|uniref:TetR/AcrR family transcriptional regulator n=1 Tax=Paenibacillus crassostreae TaxID=1763538 RepID=UPI000A3F3FAE|nr:TetR/AcrR family transcriptional regulator [Paenibacillus crassostreae]
MRALANAAFELALEHGLDGFIVEDVVGRAGYSRRTFTNYFSCKEEAVASGATIFNDTIEIEQLLENLSEDTPPIDILFQLIKTQLTVDYLKKIRELALICKKNPSMEPYFLDVIYRLHVDAQKTLIIITNGKVDEVYIHLLVGAVYGAMLPVIDGSLHVEFPDQPSSNSAFHQYMEKIYKYLKNGF